MTYSFTNFESTFFSNLSIVDARLDEQELIGMFEVWENGVKEQEADFNYWITERFLKPIKSGL